MRLIDADALKKEWSMANKCEDCPQDARHCQFDQNFTRMDICEMIDEAPTIGGWISVKDALPRPGNDVIVLMDMQDRGKWRILAYLGDEDEPEWISGDELWEGEDDAGEHITHWMPLPEPPKEVSGDA